MCVERGMPRFGWPFLWGPFNHAYFDMSLLNLESFGFKTSRAHLENSLREIGSSTGLLAPISWDLCCGKKGTPDKPKSKPHSPSRFEQQDMTCPKSAALGRLGGCPEKKLPETYDIWFDNPGKELFDPPLIWVCLLLGAPPNSAALLSKQTQQV